MISSLGYDVLFQDVDMVWFRDPLEYFHDENVSGLDFGEVAFVGLENSYESIPSLQIVRCFHFLGIC